MTTGPLPGATEAMLFVADFPRAVEFYTTKLGFDLAYAWGDPPYYGMVRRGEARLALRLVCEPVFVGDIRARLELLSASLLLRTRGEIDALGEQFSAAGVPFYRGPTIEPWGARDFIIQDPDGNLVLFSGPAA